MGHINWFRSGEKNGSQSGWSYVISKALRTVLIVILLSVLIFFLLHNSEVSATSYGDLNGDGRIDVQDVVLVMRHVLGLESLTGTSKVLADVNGDGAINVRDASLITQKSLGLLAEFPATEKSGSHLVEKIIIADGISPGSKLVIVILDVADPENYRVEIAGNTLEYSEEVNAFLGEVDENDAHEDNVTVNRL